MALRTFETQPELYNAAELIMLREEVHKLGNGQVRTKRNKTLPPVDNFRFAFLMFLRTQGDTYAETAKHLGKEWEPWKGLQRAVEVRNRLTHPKSVEDLQVSDEELQVVTNAFLLAYQLPSILMLTRLVLHHRASDQLTPTELDLVQTGVTYVQHHDHHEQDVHDNGKDRVE